MINKTRTRRIKRRIVSPALRLKRPANTEQTIESLNKGLSKHILKFNTKNFRFKMRRLRTAAERLRIVRQAVVYAAALCIMLVLVYGSVASLNLTFAKQVIANGTPVGFVEEPAQFDRLVQDVETELTALMDGTFDESAEVVYITRLIFARDLTSEDVLRQNLMSTYDGTTEAYALYVDGTLLCANRDRGVLDTALEEYKNQYRPDIEGASVGFNEQVEIRQEVVPVAYLRSKDGVLSSVTRTREEEVAYTVQENDTLWGIATAYRMSVDDLMAINPDYSETIHAGDVLKLNKSTPLLQVKVSYVETVEEAIPYETERIEDNTLTKGVTKVTVEGADGKKLVTREVVALNGTVAALNVQQEQVLEEPVTSTVTVGTKYVAGVGTGQFARPSYGTITSRFGYRSRGYHTGLDIAASTGTSITAADDGRVTFSGWSGGYGNVVKINHGNGYETYYAHCSALLVSVGQVVSKGDLIARVGNTGNSTGPHLHFEVRLNGVPQNPQAYINIG